jgi:DNA-binding IclR family transcriptional regulator
MAANKPPEPAVLRRLRRTPGSIRSFSKLQKVVRVARRAGFAISDGELTESIVDAAAPILDSAGNAIGAIAVGARRERIGNYDQLGLLVAAAAHEVSNELLD